MKFNEKLRLLRKELNLTQEELADKLNVSRQAITKWESAEGMPDIENLNYISKLFNTSIDELIKEDLEISINTNNKYIEEIEIDHTKHFDIHINKCEEIGIISNNKETIKVEVISNVDNIEDQIKIKFDNIYNKLDIDIKNKLDDSIINIYIPEKYIDEIELKSKSKTLNIKNINVIKLEYDGSLKYLNVHNSLGDIVLNTTKCDIEAFYDKFVGKLVVNTFNSTSRVTLPKDTIYKTVVKGIKNTFVDAKSDEESTNIIELNGIGSKLIVIEK